MRNFIFWRKTLGAALTVALLVSPWAGSARAEKIDFSKVTCEAFADFEEDTMTMFYFWLDGYVSAKSGNTVFDTDGVEADLTELLKRCNANPKTTVLKVLGQ